MALHHTRSHSSGFWNDYGCGRRRDWQATSPAPRPRHHGHPRAPARSCC